MKKINVNALLTKKYTEVFSREKIGFIITQGLIKNRHCHIIAEFKDIVIYNNSIIEHMKRYYKYLETKERIPKFVKYYQNYLIYFCRPTFQSTYVNKLMKHYYEKKAEIFYKRNYGDELKEEKPRKERNKKKKAEMEDIFTESIRKNINNATLDSINLSASHFKNGSILLNHSSFHITNKNNLLIDDEYRKIDPYNHIIDKLKVNSRSKRKFVNFNQSLISLLTELTKDDKKEEEKTVKKFNMTMTNMCNNFSSRKNIQNHIQLDACPQKNIENFNKTNGFANMTNKAKKSSDSTNDRFLFSMNNFYQASLKLKRNQIGSPLLPNGVKNSKLNHAKNSRSISLQSSTNTTKSIQLNYKKSSNLINFEKNQGILVNGIFNSDEKRAKFLSKYNTNKAGVLSSDQIKLSSPPIIIKNDGNNFFQKNHTIESEKDKQNIKKENSKNINIVNTKNYNTLTVKKGLKEFKYFSPPQTSLRKKPIFNKGIIIQQSDKVNDEIMATKNQFTNYKAYLNSKQLLTGAKNTINRFNSTTRVGLSLNTSKKSRKTSMNFFNNQNANTFTNAIKHTISSPNTNLHKNNIKLTTASINYLKSSKFKYKLNRNGGVYIELED